MNVNTEYLSARVMTARPEELHLMVVDGAVRAAMQAEEALENSDFESAHAALSRAREFVIELISGLDERDDPQARELVANMKALFGFSYRRLNEADLYHDVQKLRDALSVLRRHRETWRELLRTVRRETAPE